MLNETQFGRTQSQLEYEHAQKDPNLHRVTAAKRAMGSDVRTGWDYGTPEQGQLFDPGKLPGMEAHHQLPHQFAADPRTWWHGRIMNAKTAKAPKGAGPEGFHAGTRASAVQRLQFNDRRRGVKEGMAGRMFPLRATGQFEAGFREEPPASKGFMGKGGSIKHTDLGWADKGYRYKNVVEDEGHISIGAPQRAGFLSTHREMVAAAKSRGEYVHPNVEWAAKHGPEHTGESIVNPKGLSSYRWKPPDEEQTFMPGLGYKK